MISSNFHYHVHRVWCTNLLTYVTPVKSRHVYRENKISVYTMYFVRSFPFVSKARDNKELENHHGYFSATKYRSYESQIITSMS